MNISEKIYKFLLKIPQKNVTTYGFIAKKFHIHPRTVGQILHKNKDPNIPCYKVVNYQGKLSTGYAFGGIKKQSEKLTKDGIVVRNDKINLQRYFLNNT